MKMILKQMAVTLALAALTAFAATAQPNRHQAGPDGERYVRRANYALAEQFTQKKLSQMVYSTRIRPNWFQHSDRFWYSWKTSEGTRYYIVDPAKKTKEEIFDMPRLAMQLTEIVRDPFDAAHIPMQGLELKDDKLFEFDIASSAPKLDSLGHTTSEKLSYHFVYDFASKKLTSWTTEEQKERYPSWANVSPDGTRGIYIKNHNLFLMDSTSLRLAANDPKDSLIVERALTTDGTEEWSWNGDDYSGDTVTDSTERSFPYVHWSPDGRHFALVRWDMSPVKKLWVINAVAQPRPTLQTYHYQMPGEPAPKGSLHVFDVDSGDSREVAWYAFKEQDGSLLTAPRTAKDAAQDFYSMRWLGDEKGFYMYRLSRDIHKLDLCYVAVDADSTRTLVSERMNTYLEWRDPKLLPGGDFLWWSERNGWANLYLYGPDGTLKRNLTDGAYHVEDILGVSGNTVAYSACGYNAGENPYQMHNYRVALSGGTPVQLDMDDMDVLATASDDGKYLVANVSRVDVKPFVVLLDVAAGRKVMDLEEADFSRLFEAGYQFPERFTVKAADGVTDLWGEMHKPFDFDPSKVYAIADYVYPGPQVEANEVSWRFNLRTDRLAQLGMIVITVGNRGGHPNRSKWYHNYGYGNLRDYGLEDQKCAVQQLAARYSWIDPARVGIHGHSGGGFMSTAAILTYPDFYKAAVSCAGNHDNNIYNRWWSEQHHGVREAITERDTTYTIHVATNPELAKNLKGHLLLVTGDIDDNVHPSNTYRVVNALIRANKRFDMLVLPGQRHGFGDMNEYFFWKMADYYSRWLIGDKTPRPVDIGELNND